MSKRIMNEVMCLAEDNDIKIYYQDTDSMHIEENKIPELEDLYRKKYGRELNGKMMEQFHTDFDFDSVTEPLAITSIIISKKIYYDHVQCDNDVKKYVVKTEGIKHNVEITTEKTFRYEDHIRMKGVSKGAIKAYWSPATPSRFTLTASSYVSPKK